SSIFDLVAIIAPLDFLGKQLHDIRVLFYNFLWQDNGIRFWKDFFLKTINNIILKIYNTNIGDALTTRTFMNLIILFLICMLISITISLDIIWDCLRFINDLISRPLISLTTNVFVLGILDLLLIIIMLSQGAFTILKEERGVIIKDDEEEKDDDNIFGETPKSSIIWQLHHLKKPNKISKKIHIGVSKLISKKIRELFSLPCIFNLL
ncbi:hypothetical protein ACJX0J_013024, partial [Zea mays]